MKGRGAALGELSCRSKRLADRQPINAAPSETKSNSAGSATCGKPYGLSIFQNILFPHGLKQARIQLPAIVAPRPAQALPAWCGLWAGGSGDIAQPKSK